MTQQPGRKRVLLKLSGEALMGDLQFGIDQQKLRAIAAEIGHVLEGVLNSPSWSGAVTSSEGFPALLRASNGPRPTTWA